MKRSRTIFRDERKGAWDLPFEESVISRLEVREQKLKRILVAVDFSEGSRRAFEYAIPLAKKLEAEIVLLHVFEGVPGELKVLEASFVDTSFREEAEENLGEWKKELNSQGAEAKTLFREGSAIDREIVRAAMECNADLIVLGKHGRQALLSPNTVEKVLGRAPCAVLVAA